MDLTIDRFVPVTGRVVDGGTGRGIAGMTVLARSTTSPTGTVSSEDHSNLTDADGRFTTPSPLGDVDIMVIPLDMADRSWCLPRLHRAISGPTELGDLVASRPPCK